MADTTSPMRASGYNGTIEFDGERVTIERDNMRGRLGHGKMPSVIDVTDISRIDFAEARMATNGHIRFAVPGLEIEPAFSDRNSLIFLKKHQAGVESLRQAVESALTPQPQPQAPADASEARARVSGPPATYDGHRFDGRVYTYPGPGIMNTLSKPGQGATAVFENGSARSGTTLTRLGAGAIIAGPVGFVAGALLKKNKSKNYVIVTFPDGDSAIVEGPVKDEKKMREFAAAVNRLA